MSLEQWRYRLPLLLRSVFRRGRVERELDEELAYHFERDVEQNVARGMSMEAARAAARRALGKVDLRKEAVRDTWAVAVIDKLARDVRHASRGELTFGVAAAQAANVIATGAQRRSPLAYREEAAYPR